MEQITFQGQPMFQELIDYWVLHRRICDVLIAWGMGKVLDYSNRILLQLRGIVHAGERGWLKDTSQLSHEIQKISKCS
jgi:hypothetical protein